MFNFKDKHGQMKLKELTENTTALSKIFDTEKELDVPTKKFLKRLKGYLNESFKKVKISNKPDKTLNNLFDKRRILRSQKSPASKAELEIVDNELAQKYSEKMYHNIKDEIGISSGDTRQKQAATCPIYLGPPIFLQILDPL